MRVWVNGQPYELKAGTQVERSLLPDFPAQYRTTGQQVRTDRTMMSSWLIDRWDYGFGTKRASVDSVEDMGSFWDSELETRYAKAITLPAKETLCLLDPSYSPLPAILTNNPSDVYVFAKTTASCLTAFTFVVPSTFGSKTYIGDSGGGNILAVGSIGRLDYSVAEGKWCFMAKTNEWGWFMSKQGLLGSLQNTLTIIPTLSSPTFSPFTDLSDGKAYAGIFTGSVGEIRSSQATTSIVGSRGCLNHAPYLALTPADEYAVYSDGVYAIDLTNKLLTSKVALHDEQDDSIGLDAKTFDSDNIAIPNREGLLLFDTSANSIEEAGMNLKESMPPGKSGEISALAATFQYLFAAVAPKTIADKAGILAYNRKGWHFIGKCPTANARIGALRVSANPDGIARLWALPDSLPPFSYDYPLKNPLTEGSYQYATQGYIKFPEYDGGMPEWEAGFYEAVVQGEFDAYKTAAIYYGLDGATPTQLLGIATQNLTTMQFGNGLGVAGNRIQLQAILSRGTVAGTAPVLKSLILHYLKFPPRREAFSFQIDLAATAKEFARPVSTLWDELNTLRDTSPLVPFWFGQVATKNVRLTELPAMSESHDDVYSGEESGLVRVSVTELL